MNGAETGSAARSFVELMRAIRVFSDGRLGKTLAIIASAAVLEGAGLVLLLPVAETLFVQRAGTESGLTTFLLASFAAIGITSTTAQLALMGSGFICLVVLRAIVLLRRDMMMMQLSQGFVDQTRSNLFALLATTDWPVIKQFRKAHLLDAITRNVSRLAATLNALSRGIVTGALALACLVAAFLVRVELGLLLTALTALGLGSAAIWARRSHGLGARLNTASRNVMRETTQFLDGMKTARVARAEHELTRRFDERIEQTRAAAIEFAMQQGRLRNGVQVAASLAALLTLLGSGPINGIHSGAGL